MNIPFRVTPTTDEFDITLGDYRFITDVEADLHEYVRQYLVDNDLFGG